MRRKNYLPDVVGLIALMAMVGILSIFVPSSQVPGPLWIAIYLAWAVAALFVWSNVEIGMKRWPWVMASSMVGAALWYAAIRGLSHLTFEAGEPELSKAFDLVSTFIIAPGITFIAVAGWAREFMRARYKQS